MTSIQPSDLPSAVVILCYFGGEAQLNFILSVSTFPNCLPIDHTSPNRGNDISLLTFHYTGIGTILQINLNFMYSYCKKLLIGKPFFLNLLLFYVWHDLSPNRPHSPNRGNAISLLTFHYTGIGTILQINLNFLYTYCNKFLIGKPFF